MDESKIKPLPARQCGDCTKCCEGWLPGEVYGFKFFPGRYCHFLNKTKGQGGCTIYKDRPLDPCKTFSCSWLLHPEIFPEWLKPEKSKIIISIQKHKEFEYYEFKPCGQEMSVKVLDWLLEFWLTHKVNVVYFIEGSRRRLGSEAFVKSFN